MLSHTRRYRDSLREDMRRQRLAVSERDEELATASVMQRVLSHPYLKEGRLIGSYVSTRHEIGTRELNRALTLRGHTLALPVISPVEKGIMQRISLNPCGAVSANASTSTRRTAAQSRTWRTTPFWNCVPSWI